MKSAKYTEAFDSNSPVSLSKEEGHIDLHRNLNPIVIGYSIHIGTVQNSVKHFCEKNPEQLLQKGKEQEQFGRTYPLALQEHSLADGFFGGKLLMEKMDYLEKFMGKKWSEKTTASQR